MTRVDRHDKMLKRTFQKYIIYDTHNTTSCTHIPHYAHSHTMLCTHNSHSKSPICTRFQHTTKLKTKFKISHPLLLAATTVCLFNFLNFKFKFNLVLPSTSFCPSDLHNCRKSNSLVSPVISSEYVQVLCAEMPSVVDYFLLATSWFVERNPKPEIRISKFEIWKFLPTSFSCLVPQQPPPAIYL